MGLSNGAVIVIAILIAGFVVITGAVIFKFGIRGNRQQEEGENFNQRSNEQEHYMREVRERNRAWNHFESRYGEGGGGHGGGRYGGKSTAGQSMMSMTGTGMSGYNY